MLLVLAIGDEWRHDAFRAGVYFLVAIASGGAAFGDTLRKWPRQGPITP